MQTVKNVSPFEHMGLTQPIESAVDATDAINAIQRMMEMYQVMLLSWLAGDLKEMDSATMTMGLDGLFDSVRYKTHALSEFLDNQLKNRD
ncbi:hypothetical protein [Pseudomonas helleri]|uniref:hypothetical protein n=1 Tax=Pseudomonas helleri TaxID=1608996 RepID=UPI003FD03A8D